MQIGRYTYEQNKPKPLFRRQVEGVNRALGEGPGAPGGPVAALSYLQAGLVRIWGIADNLFYPGASRLFVRLFVPLSSIILPATSRRWCLVHAALAQSLRSHISAVRVMTCCACTFRCAHSLSCTPRLLRCIYRPLQGEPPAPAPPGPRFHFHPNPRQSSSRPNELFVSTSL